VEGGVLRSHLSRQKRRRRWGTRRYCRKGLLAEGGVEGDGVEENPGWGGEEKDAEVVPPVGDVAVVLMGDAADDVEIEVLVYEEAAVAVQEEEVPGEDEGEEQQEAVEERRAEAVAESGVEEEEQEEGEEEAAAGCSFAHEGDGEAGPVEVPALRGIGEKGWLVRMAEDFG